MRVDNSKKISIGDINVTDESKVFNFINNIDSKINPILIDNVGRLMLLNEFYQMVIQLFQPLFLKQFPWRVLILVKR